MSTSDFTPGLPDVDSLARLANELFRQAMGAAEHPSSMPAHQPALPFSGAVDPNFTRIPAGDVPLHGPAPTPAPHALRPAAAQLPHDAAAPLYYFLTEAGRPGQPDAGQLPGLSTASTNLRPFDVQLIRQEFPILQERVNGRPLIWFDNAATTQKPRQVIDRLSHFYRHENSNIHRAAHDWLRAPRMPMRTPARW